MGEGADEAIGREIEELLFGDLFPDSEEDEEGPDE